MDLLVTVVSTIILIMILISSSKNQSKSWKNPSTIMALVLTVILALTSIYHVRKAENATEQLTDITIESTTQSSK